MENEWQITNNKEVNRKVQGVRQSQATVNSRHQQEEKTSYRSSGGPNNFYVNTNHNRI